MPERCQSPAQLLPAMNRDAFIQRDARAPGSPIRQNRVLVEQRAIREGSIPFQRVHLETSPTQSETMYSGERFERARQVAPVDKRATQIRAGQVCATQVCA